MIDDRIGSIGSTQGVNDSATPIAKNAATMSQKRPLCSTLSTALPSNHDDALCRSRSRCPGSTHRHRSAPRLQPDWHRRWRR